MARRYRNKTYYEDDERLSAPEEPKKVPATVYGKIIKTSALIIREGPSVTSASIGLLERNDTFKILDEKILGFGLSEKPSYFEKVDFQGKVGYILSQYCGKVGDSCGN